ncbi:PepSY domain-containing protein [Ahrensia sp. 13_GOM-1096m]|uniref:PepSY domain-containing protein n=1 Tax=Ahrensia sp. 13_GOM-1096m TaxID=1380380 RepID=UPI00047BEEB0|nr:PepSY domain-containing protein [Ahrensia sp. 13_GOM-1096m]
MKKYILPIAAISLLATSGASFASEDMNCGSADKSTWMSEEAIMEKAKELGYEPAKLKVEDGCYEVYARKDGKKFEVFMNPVTAEVVKVKSDD